jgi:hypothetical protein
MCCRVAEGVTFSEFVENVLKFTCPRHDRPDAQNVQFEKLSSFEPGFCVVPGLLRCHGPRRITFQTPATKPQASFGCRKVLGEKFST